MLTLSNYQQTIESQDINSWPPSLKEGHEFFLESVEFYNEDNDIREAIDLYLDKLNEYISYRKDNKYSIIKDFYNQLSSHALLALQKGKLPPDKLKLLDKLNIDLEELIKYAQKIKGAKQSKSIKIKNAPKEPVSIKNVEALDEEVKFIKRFIGFHRKLKPIGTVLSFIKSLQRAIIQKQIKKTSAYAKDILTIQDKLVKVYNNRSSDNDVQIEINDKDLARYVGIAGGEAVYKSVGIIKRFIGMQGKELEADKFEAFKKALNKANIDTEDPYADKVKDIVEHLKRYKSGKLSVSAQELNGLKGVLKGCYCNLGIIYNTNGKELRRCKSKKYSDSGRGACSHHKGLLKSKKALNGIMTVGEVASMEFKKLNFTGKWAELMGQPAPNFDMMLFGQPGSGKTTLLLLFGHYLATNFGDVLYISGEEYNSSPLTDKTQKLPSFPSNFHIFKNLKNLPVELSAYQFVILDSITDLGVGLDEYKVMREESPETAFILILQTTKDGKFKGGKEWEHEVEVAGEVDNGMVRIYKNRYGVKGAINFFED